MNRIAAIALFVGATLITAGSAAAQSSVVEANIPFNFTFSDTFLPAGTYTFGFDSMIPDMLIIRDRTRSVKARDYGQCGLIGPGKPHTLIFHRYGSQYFLSEVRFNSASNGVFLPARKLEKQAKKISGKQELASIAAH